MSEALHQHLLPRQKAVADALQQVLENHQQSIPQPLFAAMEYSLLSPGKRFRPMLCILVCEALGGTIEQALPAACSLEMIHTYSLIHDDLPAMDDDDLRRGRPTCHIQFGEALAILAGDALIKLAFEHLCTSYPGSIAAVSCLELARAGGAAGMVGGQVLDLAAESRLKIDDTIPETLPSLEQIHHMKTGALIRGAARLGCFVSNSGYTVSNSLDEYAQCLGLIFQITDDLLDAQGLQENAGKRVGKDASRGKLTYPGLMGLAEAQAKAATLAVSAKFAASQISSNTIRLVELVDMVLHRDR